MDYRLFYAISCWAGWLNRVNDLARPIPITVRILNNGTYEYGYEITATETQHVRRFVVQGVRMRKRNSERLKWMEVAECKRGEVSTTSTKLIIYLRSLWLFGLPCGSSWTPKEMKILNFCWCCASTPDAITYFTQLIWSRLIVSRKRNLNDNGSVIRHRNTK